MPVNLDVVGLAEKSRFAVGRLDFLRNVVFALERQHSERLKPLCHVGNCYVLNSVAVGINVVNNVTVGRFLDDDAIVSYLDGRADFHGVEKFFNVAFVHAYAAVGNVAADTFRAIGAVNAVVARNFHPTIAQRIIRTGRNFKFGVGRVNPRRINFLAFNFVIAGGRGRADFAQSEMIDREFGVAVIEEHETACRVD